MTQRAINKIILRQFRVLFCVSLAIAGISLMADTAHAQTLYLKSDKINYNVGDSFLVSLIFDTNGQTINAVNGAVLVPTDKFQIIDLRFGNSIIPIWVERPTVDYSNGTINFTGGIPGGFSGTGGPILSFTLKAKKTGQSSVLLQDIKVLLNDGKGTELKNIILKNLALKINQATPTGPSTAASSQDNLPPEPFIPMISRNQNVENNKYFVSFFAVDKDTGISRYEIKEKPIILSSITPAFDAAWTRGESPYVLKGQLWAYKVIVRACDGADNCTDEIVYKPFSPFMMGIFAVILVIITALVTHFLYWRPRRRNKKII